MRVLYFDCFSGISGDMTCGALRALGVEEGVFREAVEALGIAGLGVRFEEGASAGIAGKRFAVEGCDAPQPARHFTEIERMLGESRLPGRVKERAVAVFRRIGVAEAKVHGVTLESVHFHEVGALDSIADIVCAAAGIEALGAGKILASRPVEGTGWIDCAHGRFPVPAPATLEILRGVPLGQCEEPFEFITPTGAALLAEYAEGFGPMPEMAVERVGYGLGTRQLPGRANALRALLGEAVAEGLGPERDVAVLLETNLDDLSPELLGPAIARLLDAGALDAWFVPAQMKKNRPGAVLSVLAERGGERDLADRILRETGSFGVRAREVTRHKLARRFEEVETGYGRVRVKIGERGGEIYQAAPEFEDCRAAAERAGVPVREVHAAALAAWRAGNGKGCKR